MMYTYIHILSRVCCCQLADGPGYYYSMCFVIRRIFGKWYFSFFWLLFRLWVVRLTKWHIYQLQKHKTYTLTDRAAWQFNCASYLCVCLSQANAAGAPGEIEEAYQLSTWTHSRLNTGWIDKTKQQRRSQKMRERERKTYDGDTLPLCVYGLEHIEHMDVQNSEDEMSSLIWE